MNVAQQAIVDQWLASLREDMQRLDRELLAIRISTILSGIGLLALFAMLIIGITSVPILVRLIPTALILSRKPIGRGIASLVR